MAQMLIVRLGGEKVALGIHRAPAHPPPTAAQRGSDRPSLAARLDHVLDPIDEQGIRMPVCDCDDGLAAIGAASTRLERGKAVDHGQHAAAQSGEAGDMAGSARHRGQRLDLDDGLDFGGRQCDPLSIEADE